jgi:hypothetical protein
MEGRRRVKEGFLSLETVVCVPRAVAVMTFCQPVIVMQKTAGLTVTKLANTVSISRPSQFTLLSCTYLPQIPYYYYYIS